MRGGDDARAERSAGLPHRSYGGIRGRQRPGAARRGASNNQGPLASFFADLSREIEADRHTLDQIATATGAQPSALKQAAATAAERLSRFKIDHRMTGSLELSLLLELELLYLGIEGKHTLWRSLEALDDPRLAEFDFGKLAPPARGNSSPLWKNSG